MYGKYTWILGIVSIMIFSSMHLALASEGLPMWDKKSYQIGEWATITLQDSEKNFYNLYQDEIYIIVKSDSFKEGLQILLSETENNSSIFTGKIQLSSDIDSKNSLFVKEGDSVYSLHGSYIKSAKIESRVSEDVFPIIVSTNKASYNVGEIIKISGSLSEGNPRYPVNLSIIDPNGNIILTELMTPSYMLRFNTEIPTDNSLWKDSGNYKIETWLDYDTRKAQTVFSLSNSYDLESTTKSIKVLGSPFFIEYAITSGKISLVRPIQETNSLQFSFIPKSGGHLTVKLPRNLIDAKTSSGDEIDFEVLLEGRPGEFIEEVTSNERTLTIPYSYRAKQIEVRGTFLDTNPSFELIQSKQPVAIPDWIRNNAQWWSKGLIAEEDFLSGMQYLINQQIIHVQKMPGTPQPTSSFVPNWVKDTAGWWASEQVTDQEFLSGIGFLVEKGVIKV